MKKNISLLITLFIVSTIVVAAKPLVEKTKPAVDKVKPKTEESAARDIVKPMKKKPRRPSEVHTELELLREKFENEKLIIINGYKEDLKMLKGRKREALDDLKEEFKRKRALIRKNE